MQETCPPSYPPAIADDLTRSQEKTALAVSEDERFMNWRTLNADAPLLTSRENPGGGFRVRALSSSSEYTAALYSCRISTRTSTCSRTTPFSFMRSAVFASQAHICPPPPPFG
jgi:hypothetical protein